LRPCPCSTLFPYTTLFRSHTCPGSYPNKRLAFDGYVDTRECADCSCGTDGSCGRFARFSAPDCTGTKQVDEAPIACWNGNDYPSDRKSTRLNSSHVKTSYA